MKLEKWADVVYDGPLHIYLFFWSSDPHACPTPLSKDHSTIQKTNEKNSFDLVKYQNLPEFTQFVQLMN